MEKKTAEVRDSAAMREGTSKTSSRILDMTGLQGKVTKSGPGPMSCSGYEPENQVVQMIHTWSIYDLPFEDLKKAYDGMRTTLPRNNWKITSDGPDDSPAKTPTMRADAPDGDFSAELRLMDNRRDPQAKTKALIYVTVVSRCFQDGPAPSGAS
ncbi:hypothetical protein [Streptomyces sp. NPDC050856]|uniref:hypothetical protein n=1 Tax=Streptomyces sp. NPDC050856 TaxID=3154939 RepID=UPI0034021746